MRGRNRCLFFWGIFASTFLASIFLALPHVVAASPDYLPGSILFKTTGGDDSIRAQASFVDLPALRNRKGLRILPVQHRISGQSTSDSLYQITMDPSENVLDIVAELQRESGIEWAQPNYIYKSTFTPNDARYSEQYGLPLIDLPRAWDITLGSASVIIAIIDTGVDWTHPDLSAKIWSNPGEIANNGIDDDGNGFIDDIRGWDFVSVSTANVGNGEDPGPPDNDPIDFNRHGTHVAGIAGADTNNTIGVAGAAPNCVIMPVRAGYDDGAVGGSFTSLDIYNSLVYATDNGADIINMSFGGIALLGDPTIENGIAYAANRGVVMIAAAGNNSINIDTNNFIPAVYPETIAVSAVGPGGVFAAYSNRGASVEVAAPGGTSAPPLSNEILSTIPLRFSSDYDFLVGTSMAAPFVAGVAALYKSVYPSADATEIRNALQFGVQDLGASGRDIFFGFGLVQALKVLAFPDTTPPTISHTPATSASLGADLVISANITDNFGAPHAPSASLTYQLFNGLTPTGPKVTMNMTAAGRIFSASISVPSSGITEIQYYITATDLKPNTRQFPTNGQTNPQSIILRDVLAPKISSTAIDGDFFDPQGKLKFTINDNVMVSPNSIVFTIAGTPYSLASNAFLSFVPPVLTADLSQIGVPATSTVLFQLDAQDTTGNADNLQVTLSSAASAGLSIFGPQGPGTRVINHPNPFNPNTDASTSITFQVNKLSDIEIYIYSLNLQLVRRFDLFNVVGYQDVVWDGRDQDNDTVPNGVYPYVIRVKSGAETKSVRSKIAVLRR